MVKNIRQKRVGEKNGIGNFGIDQMELTK